MGGLMSFSWYTTTMFGAQFLFTFLISWYKHWTKTVYRSVEKVAINSKKKLPNAIADIRCWNVEKYAAFFYSLHTRVEKFWHSLHVSNEYQLLRLANVFCCFFAVFFYIQQTFSPSELSWSASKDVYMIIKKTCIFALNNKTRMKITTKKLILMLFDFI